MEKNVNNKELENIKLDDEIIEKVNGGVSYKNMKVQSSERDDDESGRQKTGTGGGGYIVNG